MTKKTLTVDIESIQPWYTDTFDVVYKYQGRGVLMTTGRGMGKSTFARLWNDIMDQPIQDLELGEGRIYGARYYTVRPVGGNWLDMETWCTETFGQGSRSLWGEKTAPEPAQRWYMNDRKFWFREVKDRDWFILRWNS